ncbi:MAG: hypothetical protein HGA24_04630 [Candidatus Aminicenantes bacterium]|nr:hypothetical protein [Candidatus Aminicenantes bacterium]
MKKHIIFMGLIAACALAAATVSAGGRAPSAAAQPGFDLLDRLVVLVVKSAEPGGGGGDIGQGTLLMAKDLKAAREAKRVDDLFAVRYSRLLSAVRLAATMDPEVLYWPMYRYAMADFIEERTGQGPDWKALAFMVNDHGGAGVGLAAIADAVLSEVVALHLHLENLSRREEIRQSYLDKGLKAAGALK